MLVTASAHAEPWYRNRLRVAHVAMTAAGGIFYVTTGTVLKTDLAPATCSWCMPPAIDVRVRNALVWSTPSSAAQLSDATGLFALPIAALVIDGLPGLSRGPDYAQLIDDTLPIVEAEVVTQVVTNAVKFSVGRQRPYAHFGPVPYSIEDNLSFFLRPHVVRVRDRGERRGRRARARLRR